MGESEVSGRQIRTEMCCRVDERKAAYLLSNVESLSENHYEHMAKLMCPRGGTFFLKLHSLCPASEQEEGRVASELCLFPNGCDKKTE